MTQAEKQRLIEIKFFMLIKQLKENIEPSMLYSFIKSLCELYDLKFTHINYMLSMIERITYQPTIEELIIASRFLGISVRKITKFLKISNSTYYKILDEYKRSKGQSVLLIPKFGNEHYLEIVKLLKGLKDTFKSIEVVL